MTFLYNTTKSSSGWALEPARGNNGSNFGSDTSLWDLKQLLKFSLCVSLLLLNEQNNVFYENSIVNMYKKTSHNTWNSA